MTNEELLKKMSGPKYLIENNISLEDDIADSMLREFKTSYWNLIDHLAAKISLNVGDKYKHRTHNETYMLVQLLGKGWILVSSKGYVWEHTPADDSSMKIELFAEFTKVE